MTYPPALSRLLVAVGLACSAPVRAAVTTLDVAAADTPRAAWLERYTEARQGPEQTDRFVETYRVGRDAALDLSNLSGDVRVTGGSGSEIRVEAVKRVRSRDDDNARRLLEDLRIEVTQVGSRVEVRTLYPRTSGRMSGSVDYTVSVPASAAVSVKSVSGDVSVGSVNGEVRAETVSGDLQVSSTPNLVVAKTVSGDVTARDIGTATALTLASVSGNVIATDLKVRTLEAGTVSGDVQLTGVQVERLTAKSVSGNIDFDATIARGGRYEFNSHSGNVRILLAGNVGFELDANTFSGSIRSDFPVTLRSNTDNDREPRGRGGRGASNRTIRGAYGDASAVLSIRSFSGSVVISKR
ncbi:MAG: DUF4097 domain-containing protein [Acidobacteria bacterium]|nr:DUF4097 domain-containing protein [Acidobacteriota bacterium]